ncbi:hypothetical protein TNCV_2497921 [Trichonephila clavipes]|nr:hypothetical protein TNCV_2497921 [Trichonephila clavipes]
MLPANREQMIPRYPYASWLLRELAKPTKVFAPFVTVIESEIVKVAVTVPNDVMEDINRGVFRMNMFCK